MCCVYSHARMASSTSLCLGFAVPIIFHESPMVAFILCHASYYPLPVSAFIGVAACHPFSLLIHLVVSYLRYRLNMGASLALITLVLRLTGRSNWLFLFHNCTDTYALSTHTFSFYFNLGVILIYSPRSYEAGAFLISALRGLPPALDNDFFMNLPFSLPTSLCLWAINKTCIHR